MGRRRRIDLSKVPEPLRPFGHIAEKWGAVGSDDERYELADRAENDEQQLNELIEFAAQMTPKRQESFAEWGRQTDLVESHEYAKFYFLFGLLDELSIKLPRVEVDRVQAAIKKLRQSKGTAAPAERMWAARELAEMGKEARDALPALKEATRDPEPHVRAWAHAAIALIAGDVEAHRGAIRAELKKNHGRETVERMDVESALLELDKPQQERNLSRVCSAAIMNDLPMLKKLVGQVDVNAPDHNSQRAVEYAIGNDHPQALAILLAAGADPNTRSKRGEPILHDAAKRREGWRMIELLLKYGADRDARDAQHRTALQIALQYGRKRNAAMLEGSTGAS